MSPELKHKLVAAHRAGDWETAAALSQQNEKEKRTMKMNRHCKRCTAPISNSIRNISGYCRTCLNFVKHYGRGLTAALTMLLVGCVTPYKPPTDQAPPPPISIQYEATQPQIVTLEWDYLLDYTNQISGFKMMAGTNTMQYEKDLDVEMDSIHHVFNEVASFRGVVPNLSVGRTYYFNVQAIGKNGLLSVKDGEVSYTVPVPTEPPTPQTNMILVTPKWATSMNGPWDRVPTWPTISFTNPAGSLFLMFEIKK